MHFVLLYWGTPAVKLVDLYCNKKTQLYYFRYYRIGYLDIRYSMDIGYLDI